MEKRIKVEREVTSTEVEEWVIRSDDSVPLSTILVSPTDFERVLKLIALENDFYSSG